MYFLLIIFFISLAGTAAIIGRKLILQRKGQGNGVGEPLFEIPPLSRLRNIAMAKARNLGDTMLVTAVKGYLRTVNFWKRSRDNAKIGIKKIWEKFDKPKTPGDKEASKFLKMVAEYKSKIRKIKHKLKEEEGLE